MRRRWRGTAGCLALLWLAVPNASAAATGDYLTVEDAVAQALGNNPGLAELRARYEALNEVPSQRGVLPDPVVSFNALNFPADTFEYRQEPMTQLQLGVSQRFPFPGKLGLSAQASQAEADAAFDRLEEARLMLVRDVRSTWWTVHYLDRALEIVAQNRQLLKQFVEVATTKYEVGDGLQQDVLLAQLELSRLLDRRIQLDGMRESELAQLVRLIDAPNQSRIAIPRVAADSDLPAPAPEAELIARAEAQRPRLAELKHRIAAAQSRLDLAKKDYYPDFTVGAAYGFRGGDNPPNVGGGRADLVTLRLSVNLPLYPDRKRGSAVSQRTSELLGERYALEDALAGVRAEIRRASADYVRARDEVSLFETGIVPQARQTVQSMLAAYRVSEVDFLNLVRSQVTLLDHEIRLWGALSAAHQARARLAAAVGEEVTP